MIHEQGRLLVFPARNTYPLIYREAAEVNWDAELACLYSPKPREWSYLDWFKHIVSTAGNLRLSSGTTWENTPHELRRDAEDWMNANDA